MSIAAVRPDLPLATVNPVAKVAATIPLSLVLILSLDVVSATVAIACELVLFTAVGFGPLLWSPRTLPVWIAAPLTGHQHGALRRPLGRGALGVRHHPRDRGLRADRTRHHRPRHRDRAARGRALPHDRPDGPRRRARPDAAPAGQVRARGAGGAASRRFVDRRLAHAQPGAARAGHRAIVASSGDRSARRSRCWCSPSGVGAPSRPRWRRAASGHRARAPGLGPRTSVAPSGWSSQSDASSRRCPRRPRSRRGAGMSSGPESTADAAGESARASARPRDGEPTASAVRAVLGATRGIRNPARAHRRTERGRQVDARGRGARGMARRRRRTSCASTTSIRAGRGSSARASSSPGRSCPPTPR